jgi:hypothetical protein
MKHVSQRGLCCSILIDSLPRTKQKSSNVYKKFSLLCVMEYMQMYNECGTCNLLLVAKNLYICINSLQS